MIGSVFPAPRDGRFLRRAAIGALALVAAPALAGADGRTVQSAAPAVTAQPANDPASSPLDLADDKGVGTPTTISNDGVRNDGRAPALTAGRMHRLPPALRRKTLLAHNANGDRSSC